MEAESFSNLGAVGNTENQASADAARCAHLGITLAKRLRCVSAFLFVISAFTIFFSFNILWMFSVYLEDHYFDPWLCSPTLEKELIASLGEMKQVQIKECLDKYKMRHKRAANKTVLVIFYCPPIIVGISGIAGFILGICFLRTVNQWTFSALTEKWEFTLLLRSRLRKISFMFILLYTLVLGMLFVIFTITFFTYVYTWGPDDFYISLGEVGHVNEQIGACLYKCWQESRTQLSQEVSPFFALSQSVLCGFAAVVCIFLSIYALYIINRLRRAA